MIKGKAPRSGAICVHFVLSKENLVLESPCHALATFLACLLRCRLVPGAGGWARWGWLGWLELSGSANATPMLLGQKATLSEANVCGRGRLALFTTGGRPPRVQRRHIFTFVASVSAAATAPLHDSGRVRPGHGAKLPE